jgi:hypothetical protein
MRNYWHTAKRFAVVVASAFVSIPTRGLFVEKVEVLALSNFSALDALFEFERLPHLTQRTDFQMDLQHQLVSMEGVAGVLTDFR